MMVKIKNQLRFGLLFMSCSILFDLYLRVLLSTYN